MDRMVVPGNIPGNDGTAWGRPGQGTETADNVLDNGVVVYECWIRENYEEERETTDPLLGDTETVVSDSWRVVVFTGNHVLLDTTAEDLWQHNHHPYSRYVDDETGEFWPVPIVSYLAPCQIAIDRLLASMQSSAELTGNPIFMDVANSGLGRTQIVNRPGLRLQMDSAVANTQGAKPQWMPPPQMSGDVLQLINLWRQIMENISGLSSSQKGQLSTGRQAAQTMQSAQEAGFVSIRASQRNMETCLMVTGTLLCHLIAQNYSTPRIVAIVGDKGSDTSLLLAARHFYSPSRDFETLKDKLAPLVFSLNVSAGSDRPTSRQARIAEADALFAMKAVDQQYVLQAHQMMTGRVSSLGCSNRPWRWPPRKHRPAAEREAGQGTTQGPRHGTRALRDSAYAKIPRLEAGGSSGDVIEDGSAPQQGHPRLPTRDCGEPGSRAR